MEEPDVIAIPGLTWSRFHPVHGPEAAEASFRDHHLQAVPDEPPFYDPGPGQVQGANIDHVLAPGLVLEWLLNDDLG
jgi:hypothetical protein